jgi:hypothetical protein
MATAWSAKMYFCSARKHQISAPSPVAFRPNCAVHWCCRWTHTSWRAPSGNRGQAAGLNLRPILGPKREFTPVRSLPKRWRKRLLRVRVFRSWKRARERDSSTGVTSRDSSGVRLRYHPRNIAARPEQVRRIDQCPEELNIPPSHSSIHSRGGKNCRVSGSENRTELVNQCL